MYYGGTFGGAVAITALVGVLLVVYGFLGHPVLIGVGFVLVAVPVLGTWIWCATSIVSRGSARPRRRWTG